jgi:hypothetical protein
MKMSKAVIVTVVSGSETWFLMLGVYCRLNVSENETLRGIFGCKMKETQEAGENCIMKTL